MSPKAVSNLVSYVLIIAVGFTAIVIALAFHRSVTEQSLEAAAIDEGIKNMKLLENVISEVASEGIGGLRTVSLLASGGNYLVNNSTGSLNYSLTLHSSLLDSNTSKKEGNLQFTVGDTGLSIGLSYERINITGDGNEIGKGTNRLCIEKTGVSGGKPVVNVRMC